jgi:D-alanine-D-alanine ligase
MHSNCRTSLPVLLLYNLDPAWPPDDVAEAQREVTALEAALGEAGHIVTAVAVQDADLTRHLRGYHPQEFVVFNSCEELPGVAHSEAMVAQVLEMLGFAYTGSPAAVLALSWDKANVNRLLDRHGLPTPRWRVYECAQVDGWDCFPAIVKPAYEHCSLGVTTGAVVLTHSELDRRIAYVLEEFDQPALVEDFVDGREFHVTLWGNGAIQMLPPAEMDFAAFQDIRERVCTYDSKFRPGSPHYENIQVHVPAPLEPEEYRRLERVALATYRACGCRDYARLDLRLRDGTFYVLDVNPNPDISPETSMAEAARLAGHSYHTMIGHLVHLAAQRHPLSGRL